GAQEVIGEAKASLREVGRNSRQLGPDPKQNNPLVQLIVRQAATDLSPKVGNVRQALGSVTEAAVVIDSVLDNLNEIPLVSVSHLDTERLQATSGQLAALADRTQELSAMLPETNDASASAVKDRASQIDGILIELQTVAAEYEPRVVQIQDRV